MYITKLWSLYKTWPSFKSCTTVGLWESEVSVRDNYNVSAWSTISCLHVRHSCTQSCKHGIRKTKSDLFGLLSEMDLRIIYIIKCYCRWSGAIFHHWSSRYSITNRRILWRFKTNIWLKIKALHFKQLDFKWICSLIKQTLKDNTVWFGLNLAEFLKLFCKKKKILL